MVKGLIKAVVKVARSDMCLPTGVCDRTPQAGAAQQGLQEWGMHDFKQAGWHIAPAREKRCC